MPVLATSARDERPASGRKNHQRRKPTGRSRRRYVGPTASTQASRRDGDAPALAA